MVMGDFMMDDFDLILAKSRSTMALVEEKGVHPALPREVRKIFSGHRVAGGSFVVSSLHLTPVGREVSSGEIPGGEETPSGEVPGGEGISLAANPPSFEPSSDERAGSKVVLGASSGCTGTTSFGDTDAELPLPERGGGTTSPIRAQTSPESFMEPSTAANLERDKIPVGAEPSLSLNEDWVRWCDSNKAWREESRRRIEILEAKATFMPLQTVELLHGILDASERRDDERVLKRMLELGVVLTKEQMQDPVLCLFCDPRTQEGASFASGSSASQ